MYPDSPSFSDRSFLVLPPFFCIHAVMLNLLQHCNLPIVLHYRKAINTISDDFFNVLMVQV